MPLALWALHRYFETGSRRALAGFAAGFLFQALSNGYYLYFFSLAVALAVGVEVVRPRLARARLLGDLLAAAVLIALALSPFAWMYIRVQRQNAFDRGPADLFHYAARWSDYLATPGWTWGGLLQTGAAERQLYPGIFPIAFAAIGVAAGFNAAVHAIRSPLHQDSGSNDRNAENRGDNDRWWRGMLTYTLVTVVAFLVSLGPGSWRPYGALVRIVPGFSGMRVPARAGILVHLGLVTLAAAGAARVFDRLPRGVVLSVVIALAAIVAIEGKYPVSVDPFPPIEQKLDRSAYEWLRERPAGAAIELRITQLNDLHPFTLFYQFNTLVHRHPIVNGYTGWPSVLQDFLGGPAAVFEEIDAVPEALEGLRSIGVRYVLLHEWTYPDVAQAARIRSAVRAAGDQLGIVLGERQFDKTTVWSLRAPPQRVPPAPDSMQKIEPARLTARGSSVPERLGYLTDGDVETRWISGRPQAGTEWIELSLTPPRDVGRVRLETSPRGLVDYPRHLVIESIDGQGAAQALFDGSIVAQLIESLAIDERRAPVDIDLPPNQSAVLRLRQTGQTRRWFWGVHEITLWARAK